MLKSLSLDSIHCFASDAKLENLTGNSFIYAPNGSGKTSITRFLRDSDPASTALEWEGSPITLRVFNSDYLRESFASSELDGVFLLGKDSVKLEKKLIDLRADLEKQSEKLEKNKSALESKTKELDELKSNTKSTLKSLKSSIPEDVRAIWAGSKQAESLFTKALAADPGARIETDWNSISLKIATVFDQDAVSIDIPSPLEVKSLSLNDALSILEEPLVPAADLDFSQLIRKYQLSDWVSQGQQHRNRMQEAGDDHCPFCQQSLPDDIDITLAELFDTEYGEKIEELKTHQTILRKFLAQLKKYFDLNFEVLEKANPQKDLRTLKAEAEKELESLASALGDKLNEPSRKFTTANPSDTLSNLFTCVEECRAAIETHNKLLLEKTEQRKQILVDVWKGFAGGPAFDSIADYNQKATKLTEAITGISGRISNLETVIETKESELRKLEKETVSSESTIIKINDLLNRCQFHSFSLRKSDDREDGYTIVRTDGTSTDPLTLSEGERTFIAFLYFYQSLSAVRAEGESNKLIAVIDDPISSLDYSIMYVVSSLIRAAMREIRNGTHPRLTQAILLTHNPRFHNEVAYGYEKLSPSIVSFNRINKLAPLPNRIESYGRNNPVTTSYQELWKSVAALQGKNTPTPSWLPNTLRRIIESYFMMLGGKTDLYSLADGQPLQEQAVIHALVAWSHHGSHEVISSDDFAPNFEPCKVWLAAFKHVFHSTGHAAHYDMMISSGSEDIISPELD